MVRSLRFQLPALFLLGVVVAGLVSAAIALRLFRAYAQNRARDQAYAEVAREARGLTKLYARRAGISGLSPDDLELFPGQRLTFRMLPPSAVDARRVRSHRSVRFVFHPPDSKQTLLAVART